MVIPTPNGAMDLPWVIRRMPSYFVSPLQHDDNFVSPGGNPQDWAVQGPFPVAFTSAGYLRGHRPAHLSTTQLSSE